MKVKSRYLDTFEAPAHWHKNTVATVTWMKRKFSSYKKLQYRNDAMIKAQVAYFLAQNDYGSTQIPQSDLHIFVVPTLDEVQSMIEACFELPRKEACTAINAICVANNTTIEKVFGVTL